MDDERKSLLVAGISLGDISLALASLAHELPPYVSGLDFSGLSADDGDTATITAEVEKVLAGQPDPEDLPDTLIRTILEHGIERGKFLSAARCLDLLDEKDQYVEKRISLALESVKTGGMTAAARDLSIAASLDLDDGSPLFQYSGTALHEGCAAAPEKCVTRLSSEASVHGALKYLLASARVFKAVEDLSPETRRALLAPVALQMDPDAVKFYMDYRTAHNDLEDIERKEINDLKESLNRIEREIAGFTESLGRVSPGNDEGRESLEKLRRTAGSLGKEFTGVDELLEAWQFRRLRDRLEHLLESEEDLADAGKAVAGGGSSEVGTLGSMLGLIRELREKDIIQNISTIEEKLASTQVTMLGRRVHSQEHWQFLREIAFKYPVSPLMVCLKKVDDRWMVVPQWESEITGILRDHFETLAGAAQPQSEIG
ncbi:MAG: hypothetical protein ABIJ00_02610 [Candidatus Eisenbacteria bacterium]